MGYLGHLISSYVILGPFWGHLGAILEPSWGHVGAMLTSCAASKASGCGPNPRENACALGRFGTVLGRSGVFWERSGTLWGRSGGSGVSWAFWGVLGSFPSPCCRLAFGLCSARFQLAFGLLSACFQFASSLRSASFQQAFSFALIMLSYHHAFRSFAVHV